MYRSTYVGASVENYGHAYCLYPWEVSETHLEDGSFVHLLGDNWQQTHQSVYIQLHVMSEFWLLQVQNWKEYLWLIAVLSLSELSPDH